MLELLCFISEIWSEQGQFDTEHLACWQQTTTRYVIIKCVPSPLSCSMTSGKSGLWCDANLSCLRISTPQKPWSPTAELKTCWPPTMDSRSRHLPALWSNCPFNPRQPWTSSLPRCRSLHRRPKLGSPSLLLLWVYPESSVLLHSCCPSAEPCIHLPQISAFSGFTLYLEKSGSVFVCL